MSDASLPAIVPVPAHSRAKWHYPAIIACIGEGHVPNRPQVRRVTKRIRREVYPAIRLDVALRRRISHAALIALGVDQD